MKTETPPPEFTEPDYSYKFEDLTEEQKKNIYKKQYMKNYTTKEVRSIMVRGLLSACGIALIGGMLIRLLVTLAVWGYTLFGWL